MRFEGKHIVVTGGAGGIGSALCAALLDRGAVLTVVDLAETLSFPARHIRGDLSTPEGIEAVCAELGDTPVDVLINLAGVQYFGLLEEQSPRHLMLTYMINLVAPVLLTRHLLPGMKARGTGRIVNVGSIFGSIAFAHFVTYSSTKAGLKGFSESLRRELAGTGVGVTYIAPRAVRTALNSEKVLELGKAINMTFDPVDRVVARIVEALERDRKDVYIGFPESLFVRVNALLPRVVDQALAANDLKARHLLSPIHPQPV